MLSALSLKKIDHEIEKYPVDRKQSAVISALAIAQDEKGWLANETMDFIAQYLGMPPIAVYEVATFYNMYNLQPSGKYKVSAWVRVAMHRCCWSITNVCVALCLTKRLINYWRN